MRVMLSRSSARLKRNVSWMIAVASVVVFAVSSVMSRVLHGELKSLSRVFLLLCENFLWISRRGESLGPSPTSRERRFG